MNISKTISFRRVLLKNFPLLIIQEKCYSGQLISQEQDDSVCDALIPLVADEVEVVPGTGHSEVGSLEHQQLKPQELYVGDLSIPQVAYEVEVVTGPCFSGIGLFL